MTNDKKVWRWNVDDSWQSFTSMFQEASFSSISTNDIEKYHHISAALLFGGCCVESFLNRIMRTHMHDLGINEEDIIKKLRKTVTREKLSQWPFEISKYSIPEEHIATISDFLDLRNEVTHRKRADHSLYNELDEANVLTFVEAVQMSFVAIYSGLQKPFPYWLLGWNYVGMNHDETWPCLLNNQQFKYSLRRFGFDVPATLYEEANAWEAKFMTCAEGFNALKIQFYDKCPDIEPRGAIFGQPPRLCKRWWDKNLIRGA